MKEKRDETDWGLFADIDINDGNFKVETDKYLMCEKELTFILFKLKGSSLNLWLNILVFLSKNC